MIWSLRFFVVYGRVCQCAGARLVAEMFITQKLQVLPDQTGLVRRSSLQVIIPIYKNTLVNFDKQVIITNLVKIHL
jgi:hypothetical protein